MFEFVFFCCNIFTSLSKAHYLSRSIAISFGILIHLVYSTYNKIVTHRKGITLQTVVGGTAGTAMAVPLFGPIMMFKTTHFKFSFPLFYKVFFLAIKPK